MHLGQAWKKSQFFKSLSRRDQVGDLTMTTCIWKPSPRCKRPWIITGSVVAHNNIGKSVDLLQTLPSMAGLKCRQLLFMYLFQAVLSAGSYKASLNQLCFHWCISSYCYREVFPEAKPCLWAWPYRHLSGHSSLLSPHFVSNLCKWAGWLTDLTMYIFSVSWIMLNKEHRGIG